eukprot:13289103-Alexandrium_andersonii.AAC.1
MRAHAFARDHGVSAGRTSASSTASAMLPVHGVQRVYNRSHAVQHDPHRENHAFKTQQVQHSHTADG